MATSASATETLLKTKSKQKTEVDWLTTTAQEISLLDKDKAYQLVSDLSDATGESEFQLGGVLSVIQEHSQSEKEWLGEAKNFKTLVQDQFGIQYRKAMYLVGIYRALVDANVSYDKVKNLGWTKLKELASILTTKNVDSWVKKANGMTVLQLQDAIKAYKKAKAAGKDGSKVTSEVTTMTFKLHPDQKEMIRSALDKAKQEGSTEFDTVALENICVAYLGGTFEIQPQHIDLKTVMSNVGYAKVLEAFDGAFPDITLTVTLPKGDDE